MARIFYSLAGEGRGHATRARAVVEMLRNDHEITLFAPEMAYALLSEAYANSNVRVRRLAGLQFHYHGRRLSYTKTVVKSVRYVARMSKVVGSLLRRMRIERPDLCITDFEPLLPRAAKAAGIPFLSLDHQHFLAVSDFRGLPVELRWKAGALGEFTKRFYNGQCETIVSSFFTREVKRGARNVVQIGVLMRPEILAATPVHGEHLLVYLRRFSHAGLLGMLRRTGRQVIVYGVGSLPSEENIQFRQVDEAGFLRDLAGCHALICNAGNQLVGEALYLRKPVFAIPEPGNFEQEINAFHLRESGWGDGVAPRRAIAPALSAFLSNVELLRGRIDPAAVRGNEAALQSIERHLPNRTAPLPLRRKPRRKRTAMAHRLISFARTVLRNRLRQTNMPRFLTYTVTYSCNARCIMCDSWRIPSPDDLTVDEIAAVFDELPTMDAVRLTGGEPFVRADLPRIVSLVQRKLRPLVLHITTNGFLTRRIVRFCEERRQSEPLQLLVSIDAVGEKHNEIRGNSNAYQSAMETVRHLAPRQRELNLRLSVNQTIVDADGLDHYRRLRDALSPLGVRNNVVMAYDASATYSVDRGIDVAPKQLGQFSTFGQFTDDQLSELIAEIERDLASFPLLDRIAKRYYLRGIANRLLGLAPSPNPKCVALGSHLRILPNGDVPTCQFNGKVVGNLRRQSFADLWRSEPTIKQREWVRKCPGCWAECEVLPSAIYTIDLARELIPRPIAASPPTAIKSHKAANANP